MTDHDDQLLLDFRSDVPFPDAEIAARVRRAAMRTPAPRRALGLRRRSVSIGLAVAAFVLVGGSVAAVLQQPWWQGGESPVDPRSVATLARDNLPAKVDTSRARTVARVNDAALVAVPLDESGYCLVPSLGGRASFGGSCVYELVNPEQGGSDVTRSLAPHGGPWLVYGRITHPRAAALDLGPFSVPLRAGGFFLAEVAEGRWAALDAHANPGRILDSTGRTLRAGCVNWGPSPANRDTGRGSVPLWSDASRPCTPQRYGRPTVDLDEAAKLVELRLASDFSIWKAGTVVALWQAPADGGRICTYVAAASPVPRGTSRGMPGGPGQCHDREPTASSPVGALDRVSFSVEGGGIVMGQAPAGAGVARVVLEAASGATELPLSGGWFIGQLPEGGAVGELPPGGPLTLIAYDRDGKELARKSLEQIRKAATPG